MPRTDLHQQLQWAEAEIEGLEGELRRLACHATEERELREKAERQAQALRRKLEAKSRQAQLWQDVVRQKLAGTIN